MVSLVEGGVNLTYLLSLCAFYICSLEMHAGVITHVLGM